MPADTRARRKPRPAPAPGPVLIGDVLAEVLDNLARDTDPAVREWSRQLAEGDRTDPTAGKGARR